MVWMFEIRRRTVLSRYLHLVYYEDIVPVLEEALELEQEVKKKNEKPKQDRRLAIVEI